jgi:hypothetical protein
MNMKMQINHYRNTGIAVTLFVSIVIFLVLNINASPFAVLAKSGGLSANSVNRANVATHTTGNTSELKSGGLSANSVNRANVTTHTTGNTSELKSGGLSANSVNRANSTS